MTDKIMILKTNILKGIDDRLIELKSQLAITNDKLQENELFQKKLEIEKEIAAFEERADRNKEAIITYMLENNSDKIEVSKRVLTLQNYGKASVEVVNIDEVPAEFIRIKKEVDKREVQKLVNETGVVVPGVNIIKNDSWKLKIKEA